ncbi:MAG: hypothetical protein PHH36_08210 [Sideroxydans sp.]|nr:hypothetical protein [Sideroxydans sp.]
MKTEASRSLKWLYCLTLIAVIFPSGVFGAAGWIGLATGGGLFRGGIIMMLILLGLFIYRIVLVVRHSHTLNAFIPGARIKVMRRFGIFLMAVGLLGSFAIFLVKPIALGIFGKPGDSGVAFFVTGMYLYLLSSVGFPGLLMFEASRLFGFEAQFGVEVEEVSEPKPIHALNIKHPRSEA